MRKIIACIFAIMAIATLSGCSETVESGNVGVYVRNSFFGESGVDMTEIAGPGRHMIAPTTSIIEYDTRPYRKDESFHDLITSQSVPVSFQATMQIMIIPEQVPLLHSKFGQNFYENNIQKQFQNLVRDFARRHTVAELTTDPLVTNNGQDSIREEVEKLVKKENIPIVIKSVTIGAVSPPKDLLDEYSRTAAQNQRAATESSRARAELSRKEAEENKAIADKAYMDKMGMVPAEYLQGRIIDNNREVVELLKDNKNVSILVSLGGNSVMPTVAQKMPERTNNTTGKVVNQE